MREYTQQPAPSYSEVSSASYMSGHADMAPQQRQVRPRRPLAEKFHALPSVRFAEPSGASSADMHRPLLYQNAYGGTAENDGAASQGGCFCRVFRSMIGGCMKGGKRAYHRSFKTKTYVGQRLADGATVPELLNQNIPLERICSAMPHCSLESLVDAGMVASWTHEGQKCNLGSDGWGALIRNNLLTMGNLPEMGLMDLADCRTHGMSVENLQDLGLTVPQMMNYRVEETNGEQHAMLDPKVLQKYTASVPVGSRFTARDWVDLGLNTEVLTQLGIRGSIGYQSHFGMHPTHLAKELGLYDRGGVRDPDLLERTGLTWDAIEAPAAASPPPASSMLSRPTIVYAPSTATTPRSTYNPVVRPPLTR